MPAVTTATRQVNILLVDDDDVDVEVVLRAFKRHRIPHPVRVVRNGVEALQALRGDGAHAPMPRPYMIILDLKMPRMNGLEFLQELRADASLRDSIVFVLITSEDRRDKAAAYDKIVAGYISKARAGDDLEHALQLFREYWNVVDFPDGKD